MHRRGRTAAEKEPAPPGVGRMHAYPALGHTRTPVYPGLSLTHNSWKSQRLNPLRREQPSAEASLDSEDFEGQKDARSWDSLGGPISLAIRIKYTRVLRIPEARVPPYLGPTRAAGPNFRVSDRFQAVSQHPNDRRRNTFRPRLKIDSPGTELKASIL